MNRHSKFPAFRRGRVDSSWLLFLTSLVVLVGLLAVMLLWKPHATQVADNSLTIYCAAGIKVPVAAAAQDYETDFGIPVHIQYGGSQTLLTQAEIAHQGDLYIPADDSYIDIAHKKGLNAEVIPLARMTPVIAVAQGNPKGIHSIDDLLQPGLRISQANPDAAAIGKVTRKALMASNQWDALKSHTLVFKDTVNNAAEDVKIGAADAAIIWDSLAKEYPTLDVVHVPQLDAVSSTVSITVLNSTKQPTAALRFARYLGAPGKGLHEFQSAGYRVVDGDEWAVTPELHIMCGAMLRPAIETTIEQFEQREGCKIARVYNGCGILVAQMHAGDHPDAYFACDVSFMKQVKEMFLQPTNISGNQLVILVPKDNPHHIQTLADLAQPNLRLGIGHEKQCALGALTQTTLQTGGVYEQVLKNVAVRSPTGDFLVNQLKVGSLDATIVYISNAAGSQKDFIAIPIDIPCALATEPIAVGTSSNHRELMSRLVATFESPESKERFIANGFTWKYSDDSTAK